MGRNTANINSTIAMPKNKIIAGGNRNAATIKPHEYSAGMPPVPFSFDFPSYPQFKQRIFFLPNVIDIKIYLAVGCSKV